MSVDTKERMDDLEKLIQRFSDAEFSCGEAEANTEEFTEALRGADVAERNLRKYVHTLLSRLSVLEKAMTQAMGFIGQCPHHVFKDPKAVVAFWEANAKYAPNDSTGAA